MQDRQGALYLVAAWVGWISNLLMTHWSAILSAAVGVAAIGASLYSVKVNRDKLRRARAHDEALCSFCRAGSTVECPYPAGERPSQCKFKNARK